MEEKYLPLGSVVLLKGATTKLMITGYAVVIKETKTFYDYSGCLYPVGIISQKENPVFNHEQIEKVISRGYESEAQIEFINKLKQNLTEKVKEDLLNS